MEGESSDACLLMAADIIYADGELIQEKPGSLPHNCHRNHLLLSYLVYKQPLCWIKDNTSIKLMLITLEVSEEVYYQVEFLSLYYKIFIYIIIVIFSSICILLFTDIFYHFSISSIFFSLSEFLNFMIFHSFFVWIFPCPILKQQLKSGYFCRIFNPFNLFPRQQEL